MNNVTRDVLRYAKSDNSNMFDWKTIRDCCLADHYGHHMELKDVTTIILYIYTAVAADARFDMPNRHRAVEALVMAPADGWRSQLAGRAGPIRQARGDEADWSLEEMYNKMLNYMMIHLQLTRVDWCRHELWPELKDVID